MADEHGADEYYDEGDQGEWEVYKVIGKRKNKQTKVNEFKCLWCLVGTESKDHRADEEVEKDPDCCSWQELEWMEEEGYDDLISKYEEKVYSDKREEQKKKEAQQKAEADQAAYDQRKRLEKQAERYARHQQSTVAEAQHWNDREPKFDGFLRTLETMDHRDQVSGMTPMHRKPPGAAQQQSLTRIRMPPHQTEGMDLFVTGMEQVLLRDLDTLKALGYVQWDVQGSWNRYMSPSSSSGAHHLSTATEPVKGEEEGQKGWEKDVDLQAAQENEQEQAVIEESAEEGGDDTAAALDTNAMIDEEYNEEADEDYLAYFSAPTTFHESADILLMIMSFSTNYTFFSMTCVNKRWAYVGKKMKRPRTLAYNAAAGLRRGLVQYGLWPVGVAGAASRKAHLKRFVSHLKELDDDPDHGGENGGPVWPYKSEIPYNSYNNEYNQFGAISLETVSPYNMMLNDIASSRNEDTFTLWLGRMPTQSSGGKITPTHIYQYCDESFHSDPASCSSRAPNAVKYKSGMGSDLRIPVLTLKVVNLGTNRFRKNMRNTLYEPRSEEFQRFFLLASSDLQEFLEFKDPATRVWNEQVIAEAEDVLKMAEARAESAAKTKHEGLKVLKKYDSSELMSMEETGTSGTGGDGANNAAEDDAVDSESEESILQKRGKQEIQIRYFSRKWDEVERSREIWEKFFYSLPPPVIFGKSFGKTSSGLAVKLRKLRTARLVGKQLALSQLKAVMELTRLFDKVADGTEELEEVDDWSFLTED